MTIKKKSASARFMEQLTGGEMTLGKLLEAIRLGEESTQTDLARRLSVSRAHLCDIENGRRIVSPERAARWAKVLGYSPERFVKLAVQDSLNKAGLKLQVEVRAA